MLLAVVVDMILSEVLLVAGDAVAVAVVVVAVVVVGSELYAKLLLEY